MEFKFSVNELFRAPIVEITNNLVPPGFKGDRRQLCDAISKVSEVVNSIGEASAAAQRLPKPITTSERLRNAENQKLYLLIDREGHSNRGAVTGMLKTGKKALYMFDRNGQHYQVQPNCILDFYVHESRQRAGLGKHLFEHMLKTEEIEPVKLAIDRPSDKFLAFLNKHYNLNSVVRQMNNYVVYDGFFPKSSGEDTANNNSNVQSNAETPQNRSTIKAHANGLQEVAMRSYGRYGAPRPPCSMGQIIHNQSSTVSAQEPTGVSLNIRELPPKPKPSLPQSVPSQLEASTDPTMPAVHFQAPSQVPVACPPQHHQQQLPQTVQQAPTPPLQQLAPIQISLVKQPNVGNGLDPPSMGSSPRSPRNIGTASTGVSNSKLILPEANIQHVSKTQLREFHQQQQQQQTQQAAECNEMPQALHRYYYQRVGSAWKRPQDERIPLEQNIKVVDKKSLRTMDSAASVRGRIVVNMPNPFQNPVRAANAYTLPHPPPQQLKQSEYSQEKAYKQQYQYRQHQPQMVNNNVAYSPSEHQQYYQQQPQIVNQQYSQDQGKMIQGQGQPNAYGDQQGHPAMMPVSASDRPTHLGDRRIEGAGQHQLMVPQQTYQHVYTQPPQQNQVQIKSSDPVESGQAHYMQPEAGHQVYHPSDQYNHAQVQNVPFQARQQEDLGRQGYVQNAQQSTPANMLQTERPQYAQPEEHQRVAPSDNYKQEPILVDQRAATSTNKNYAKPIHADPQELPFQPQQSQNVTNLQQASQVVEHTNVQSQQSFVPQPNQAAVQQQPSINVNQQAQQQQDRIDQYRSQVQQQQAPMAAQQQQYMQQTQYQQPTYYNQPQQSNVEHLHNQAPSTCQQYQDNAHQQNPYYNPNQVDHPEMYQQQEYYPNPAQTEEQQYQMDMANSASASPLCPHTLCYPSQSANYYVNRDPMIERRHLPQRNYNPNDAQLSQYLPTQSIKFVNASQRQQAVQDHHAVYSPVIQSVDTTPPVATVSKPAPKRVEQVPSMVPLHTQQVPSSTQQRVIPMSKPPSASSTSKSTYQLQAKPSPTRIAPRDVSKFTIRSSPQQQAPPQCYSDKLAAMGDSQKVGGDAPTPSDQVERPSIYNIASPRKNDSQNVANLITGQPPMEGQQLKQQNAMIHHHPASNHGPPLNANNRDEHANDHHDDEQAPVEVEEEIIVPTVAVAPKAERPSSLLLQQQQHLGEAHINGGAQHHHSDVIMASAEEQPVSASRKTPSHLTEQGFFDLKFYHNKLW